MDKLYRRTQIWDLLRTEAVATQDDLRRKLRQRGIRVTQATVSRDIDELGLVKTRAGYRRPEAPQPPAPLQPTLSLLLKEFLTDSRQAGNLVVLKTHPGNAPTVAAALDCEAWPEMVGTVAGDDTIFVATRSPRHAARFCKKIQARLAA